MDKLKGYTDVYPVHDSFCEGLLGAVIEGKTQMYVLCGSDAYTCLLNVTGWMES